MQPDPEQINGYLAKILASPEFGNASRLKELLSYLVSSSLSGDADRLKGYAIGVDVFDRPEDFDPAIDSIVRVQVGRLRKLLETYYGGSGESDEMIITLPKGSYAPVFASRQARSAPAAETETGARQKSGPPPTDEHRAAQGDAPWRRRAFLSLSAALVLACILLVMLVRGRGAEVDLAIVEPQGPVVFVERYATSNDTELSRRLRDGLQYELVDHLTRFPDLFVLGIDTVRAGARSGAGPRVDFRLTGTVQVENGHIRVASQLVQDSSGAVVWSEISDGEMNDASGILRIQSDTAASVATALGQPNGVIQENMRMELTRAKDVALEDYLCVLDAYEYERAKTRAKHAEVRDCLEKATRRSASYASAWAKLSWVYGDEQRYGFNLRKTAAPPFERARDAAERAVQADPTNAQGHQYLALALFSLHADAGFRGAAQRALELNPNNAELLADIGWNLVLLNDSERGKQMIEKALVLNPGHPPWYHTGLALYALQNNLPEMALEEAKANSRDGGSFSRLLLAAAYRLNDDEAAADAIVAEVAQSDPDIVKNPRRMAEAWRVTPDVAKLMFGADAMETT